MNSFVILAAVCEFIFKELLLLACLTLFDWVLFFISQFSLSRRLMDPQSNNLMAVIHLFRNYQHPLHVHALVDDLARCV